MQLHVLYAPLCLLFAHAFTSFATSHLGLQLPAPASLLEIFIIGNI